MPKIKTRMTSLAGLRARLPELLIGSVFVMGAASFALAVTQWSFRHPGAVVALAALAFLCERFPVRLYFDGRITIGFVIVLFAALWLGPAGTAVVTTVSVVGMFPAPEQPIRRLLFNFGQRTSAGFVAAALASALEHYGKMNDPLLMAAGGAAMGATYWAITSIATALIISLTTRRELLRIHRESFAWMLPHYLGLGTVAGGLVAVEAQFGIVVLLVVSAPIALSRYAMKQVVDKTRDHVVRLERSNDDLRRAHVEITGLSDRIRESYDVTLESLVAALDLRDRETKGHSSRVATHSLELAALLGIKDPDEQGMIYRGALMHDVGKIGVPDGVLLKPGKLTEEEWEFMRKHPAMGYRILAQVPYLREAGKIVLAHHERWDGGGYPRGLKRENIPIGARIFAISDTYDAIISDRPYRKGQSPDAALAEILRCGGTQFDPKVVEAFEALFPRWREEAPGVRAPISLPAWRRENGREQPTVDRDANSGSKSKLAGRR